MTEILKSFLDSEGRLDGAIDYHVNGAYGKSIGAHDRIKRR